MKTQRGKKNHPLRRPVGGKGEEVGGRFLFSEKQPTALQKKKNGGKNGRCGTPSPAKGRAIKTRESPRKREEERKRKVFKLVHGGRPEKKAGRALLGRRESRHALRWGRGKTRRFRPKQELNRKKKEEQTGTSSWVGKSGLI